MYYQGTITIIRKVLRNSVPTEDMGMLVAPAPGEKASPLYLLWMCDEVSKMDTSSIDAAIKAASWMGWINAHIEMHGLWDNSLTRDLIRHDKSKGFHKPHQK